jgi:hypothetical protein
MKFRLFIVILPFLWWGFDVRAQAPEQIPMPEKWQLTLDVIKSKAQALGIKNNGLQVEYQELVEQAQKLQQSIDDQQYKNEQMSRFLKEQHGRTEQQVRIKELTQSIKTKSQEAGTYQNTVHQPADDQLPQLRKQLEDESKQEVLLENELEALKNRR